MKMYILPFIINLANSFLSSNLCRYLKKLDDEKLDYHDIDKYFINNTFFESLSIKSVICDICDYNLNSDIYTVLGKKTIELQKLLLQLKDYNYKVIFIDSMTFDYQELVQMKYNFKTKCTISKNGEIIGGIYEMYGIIYDDHNMDIVL
jgi:hypothetical protein